MCQDEPYLIETVDYKGYQIKIFQDFDPESPREWDNLGEMICFHDRYQLGDEHSYSVEEVNALVTSPYILSLPLYLYDHGGITIRTHPFSCPWDSGRVGYIIVDKEKILKEYGGKRVTNKIRERVLSVLKSEVSIYDDFLTGRVYGYEIEKEGEEYGSCWGYFGDYEEYMLPECKRVIDECYIPKAKEKEKALEVLR